MVSLIHEVLQNLITLTSSKEKGCFCLFSGTPIQGHGKPLPALRVCGCSLAKSPENNMENCPPAF